MKGKIKKLKGTSRQLDIEIPSQKVEEVYKEVLEDIRKTVTIPGFRTGKAPMDIVQKHHHEEATDEVQRRLVSEGYQWALNDHGITPVSLPEVSDVVMEASGGLKFKAKVDTHPEIKLQKYKGLKVSAEKITVEGKEVEETIERFQSMNAEFSDIERSMKKGDFGVCDVETFMDDKLISKKRENMWIEADKETSLLGMGEELIGLKKGDRKDMEIVLPENYPDEKYAGKKAIFKVEVKETK